MGSIFPVISWGGWLNYGRSSVRQIKTNINGKVRGQNVCNKAKGWISKWVFQEKAPQIFRKTNISYPLTRTCAYQGVRNVCFSENLACFVFLKHPFWNLPFCLITDEVRKSYCITHLHQSSKLEKLKSVNVAICLLGWFICCENILLKYIVILLGTLDWICWCK